MKLLEKLDFIRKLKEAEDNGKIIETLVGGFDWHKTTGVEINADNILRYPEHYRIKPEPKVRPWTADEVPVGAVIVAIKGSGHNGKWLIGGSGNDGVYLSNSQYRYTYQEMLKGFTLADGSPCGTTDPA